MLTREFRCGRHSKFYHLRSRAVWPDVPVPPPGQAYRATRGRRIARGAAAPPMNATETAPAGRSEMSGLTGLFLTTMSIVGRFQN
jgi:hypothetical protein